MPPRPIRVWLITGASTGLGRALCENILKKGETAVAAARRTHLLDDLVKEYTSERILVLKMDVTQPQDVSDGFARARAVFGRIDVVFNNAGFADAGEMESMPDAQARAIMDTNFWGAVTVTREAVRFFRESNPAGAGGRLLQMSSMFGLSGLYCTAFYAASKHALEGFTKCVVQELDPAWNIKVTVLEPGFFQSEINSTMRWSSPHPAYTYPASPVTRHRAALGGFVPPGDPIKAAEAFYKAALLPNPPLHLLLGKDSLSMTKGMMGELEKDIKDYESWSDDLEVMLESST
ncbi:NAD-P-binding protein [Trametes gibbosa]|nr:NAD-P-binding protein [Trametes gibbosa]